jgi:hypothetical protein
MSLPIGNLKHNWQASRFRWESDFKSKFKFVRKHAPAERPGLPHSLRVWLFLDFLTAEISKHRKMIEGATVDSGSATLQRKNFLAFTQTNDCAGTIELIPRSV